MNKTPNNLLPLFIFNVHQTKRKSRLLLRQTPSLRHARNPQLNHAVHVDNSHQLCCLLRHVSIQKIHYVCPLPTGRSSRHSHHGIFLTHSDQQRNIEPTLEDNHSQTHRNINYRNNWSSSDPWNSKQDAQLLQNSKLFNLPHGQNSCNFRIFTHYSMQISNLLYNGHRL